MNQQTTTGHTFSFAGQDVEVIEWVIHDPVNRTDNRYTDPDECKRNFHGPLVTLRAVYVNPRTGERELDPMPVPEAIAPVMLSEAGGGPLWVRRANA